MRHILKDCDWPVGMDRGLDVRGFWRVGRDQPPELRHPVLTQVALAHTGHSPPNDTWLFPETARLADYGLGHDDRAKHHQPVASRLGPRFYDWQLAQAADEGTRERHIHARNLLGELGYARLFRKLGRSSRQPTEEQLREVAESRAKYEAGPPEDQTDIFE